MQRGGTCIGTSTYFGRDGSPVQTMRHMYKCVWIDSSYYWQVLYASEGTVPSWLDAHFAEKVRKDDPPSLRRSIAIGEVYNPPETKGGPAASSSGLSDLDTRASPPPFNSGASLGKRKAKVQPVSYYQEPDSD